MNQVREFGGEDGRLTLAPNFPRSSLLTWQMVYHCLKLWLVSLTLVS